MLVDTSYHRMIQLEDYEALFRRAHHPVFLNKVRIEEGGYSDVVNESLLGVHYVKDKSGKNKSISKMKPINFKMMASCKCGYLDGNANEGLICPQCLHEVKSPLLTQDGSIPHNTWISFPDDIPGVLNPVVYLQLTNWLAIKGSKNKRKVEVTNYVDAILDPTVELPQELEGVVTGRGFKWFYDNFDMLIDYFSTTVRKGSIKQSEWTNMRMKWFINLYRDRIFTNKLPCLADVLHSVTTASANETGGRLYTDKGVEYALNAVHILSMLEFAPASRRKWKTYDHKLLKAYKSYITYIQDCCKVRYDHKKSLIRQHIYGMRGHLTFRGVIVPAIGEHVMDELTLPWAMIVNLLIVHIVSRLINQYGYTVDAAMMKQYIALVKYDSLIDKIIGDLIAEGTHKGLPVLFVRNPSIKRGNMQLMFVTGYTKDPEDHAIVFSPRVVKDPNADYDGDQMTGVLLPESDAVPKFMKMHVSQRHQSPMGVTIRSDISVPNTALVVCNSFLGSV